MIVALAAGVVLALSGVGYVGYKYHSAKSALAAVKAELVKIEGEVSVSGTQLVQGSKVIARLKALL